MYFVSLVGEPGSVARALDELRPHLGLLERVVGGQFDSWQFTNGCLLADGRAWLGSVAADPPHRGGVAPAGVVSALAGYAASTYGCSTVSADELLDGVDTTLFATGEFNAVRIESNSTTAELVAAVDRFDSRPAYYAAGDELVVVSNDALAVAIASDRRDLEDGAAFDLLRFSHSTSTDTTIDGVKRLAPGHRLCARWMTSGCRWDDRPYAVLAYETALQSPSDEEVRAAAGDLRGAAARLLKRTQDAPQVERRYQLSGGLDSRITCGALADSGAGELGRATTTDLSDRDEMAIAEQVACRLGLQHDSLTLASAQIRDLRIGWLLTAGQVPVHTAAGNVIGYRSLSEWGAPLALFGAWPGDVLAGSYVPVRSEYVADNHISHTLLSWARQRGYPSRIMDASVDPMFVDEWHPSSTARVVNALEETSGPSAAHRVTTWALAVRQAAFSFVSPARLLPHVAELTPCLDLGYCGHFLRLPARDIVAKNFYRRLVLAAQPRLADICYHATGRPVSADPVMPSATQAFTLSGLKASLGAASRATLSWNGPVGAVAVAAFRRSRRGGLSHELAAWSRHFAGLDLGESPYVSVALRDGGINGIGPLVGPDVQLLGAHLALAWTRTYLREYPSIGAWADLPNV